MNKTDTETTNVSPLAPIDLLDAAVNNAETLDEICELLASIKDAISLLREAQKACLEKLRIAKKAIRDGDDKYADVLVRVAKGESMSSIAKDKGVTQPVISHNASRQLFELNYEIARKRPSGMRLFVWIQLNKNDLGI